MASELVRKSSEREDGEKKGSLKQQNFGLTEVEFSRMLEKLKSGDDGLFEKVFLAHFEDCIQYLIHRYNIQRSRAYDATMEALLKFRKRMIDGKISYGNMRFLFTRMAGQFLSEDFKQHLKLVEATEEEHAAAPKAIDDEILDALDLAWAHLCKECRGILNKHYYQKAALKSLALQFKKTESALRKQKQRCLDKLRASFIKYYQS